MTVLMRSVAQVSAQFQPIEPPQLRFRFTRALELGREDELQIVAKAVDTSMYTHKKRVLENIKAKNDQYCRVLYDTHSPVGVVVHRKTLSNEHQLFGLSNSLEISIFSCIDTALNEEHANVMLSLVIQNAQKCSAQAIQIIISARDLALCYFFSKKGFVRYAVFEKMGTEDARPVPSSYLFGMKVPPLSYQIRPERVRILV